jgi:type I restriction-modification system DNA methylase subunit
MALSWNEIKDRAVAFSKEWADTHNEEADAKPFLEAFLNVFGITRKRVSTFEHRVKKLSEADGYIDLLWKGMILIEMKSLGKNLDKAFTQAKDYIHGLREHELPKYILVSDFHHFRLFDTEDGTTKEFTLHELVKNVQHFGFIAGYQKKVYKEQDPVNIKAALLMGKLHDRLKEIGYDGHPLEVYLVRILFCLFAEDTTIFDIQQFQDYIAQRTHEDGSDLAPRIQELFQVLNTPPERRFKNLHEQLNAFPYVNGKLFEEVLPSASFDAKMRQSLLECCYLDWAKISPAIFGSMFQSVMNPTERRNLGAHYTSEKNILKLIKPLFLEELWAEFEAVKGNRGNLQNFHKKLSTLKFLDPACGCGNFLVITYRELRLLEVEILRALNKTGQGFLDVREIIWLDVDMMSGIEYEEFPARIAEVAMWLIDHQMNMAISQEFGQYFVRLPLKKAANIVHGNALQVDWDQVVPKTHLSYILGNPPFIGKQVQNSNQKKDMDLLFGNVKGGGTLDYVAGWYIKAAKYIQHTSIKVAFVSTNSIAQGEQVGIIWGLLFKMYNIKIHFAHTTFKWANEAKGNAAVHVVIVGFASYDVNDKYIFEYDDIKGEPHLIKAKNINPYLLEGKDMFITTRTTPLCAVPEIIKGSETTDDGHFMLLDEEVEFLASKYPESINVIRPFVGGGDFINGRIRHCLWLKNAPIDVIKNIPFIQERIQKVKNFRLSSSKERTKYWANFPSLFTEDRQPKKRYLILPKISSEKRQYIPFAYLDSDVIVNNTASTIVEASNYLFGVLESKMHMTWMSYVCGRMKSDYIYSNKIVYNNYPWPENPTDKQTKAIEQCAQQVLDVRASFPDSSLADLYHPLTMPPALTKAHQELDKAVDLAYRPQPFINETKRMEFLFELYEKYTAGLFAKEKVKKPKKVE